jgi:hypothetical protein
MQDFRNLKVWDKAHELALDIYRITWGFPKHELLARDLGFLSQEDHQHLQSRVTEIKRMLATFIGKLRVSLSVDG